jgi:ABC-2 type transport system ATP-binding protein
MNQATEVENLTKVYGRPESGMLAVDHISFEVRQGEVFGFLGPNGAGKTTTIRMLTGLSRPTAGQAWVLGHDLVREMTTIKKRIGVVPETSNLYDELTAFENLVFAMQLYGVPRAERKPRAEDLLARFRLSDKRNAPFASLSRGMKRALTIATALVHRPPLIFLDEPTTGLDVISARALRQMIAELRHEGVTVFLTTHYLEEAERLCDRIAIIVNGHIVALDTVEKLKASVQGHTAVEVTLGDQLGCVEVMRVEGDDVDAALRAVLARAAADSLRVLNVATIHPTLEEVFVRLTSLAADVMLAEKGGKGQSNAGSFG